MTNTNRPLIINSNITEWDIKSAGPSLLEYYHLVDDKTLQKIQKIEDKKKKNIKVGLLTRDDKELAHKLEKAFKDITTQFMKDNNLDSEYDVISVKRDAVFVVNRDIKVSQYGPVLFRQKSQYHAFALLNPLPSGKATEWYFGDMVEVKNLTKRYSETVYPEHKDYLIQFVNDVISVAESTNMDKKKINRFLHDFIDSYKKKELEFEYYREFMEDGKYRFKMDDAEMLLDHMSEDVMDNIDISYNYLKIILPLVQIIS